MPQFNKSKYNQPDSNGKYGIFGGKFVSENLMPLINELEISYFEAKNDHKFQSELKYYLNNFVGRPSPLYLAKKLTEYINGAKIYLKRDELNHTGSHKINNCLGQILLEIS